MIDPPALLRALRALCSVSRVDEARDHLTLTGSPTSHDALRGFVAASEAAGLEIVLWVQGESATVDELTDHDDWRLPIGKAPLLAALGRQPSEGEVVYLFCSGKAFADWAARVSTLADHEPWPERLSIVVDGIDAAVAGPRLRVGALDRPLIPFDDGSIGKFPKEEDYASLIHLSSRLHARRIHQSALTTGDLGSPWFSPIRAWAENDAALLFANEVVVRDGQYVAILRGNRRIEVPLRQQAMGDPTATNVAALQTAVTWTFEANTDTRHTLIVDRLALDGDEEDSLIRLLRRSIVASLRDARERYQIFVLDNKDSAAKELRDVLKDVRAQADLYAAKSRDLVSGALRDILAVLLLIGLGLVGRLESDKLLAVSHSHPIDLFMHLLGAYFVLSGVLQVSVQSRDLWLSRAELLRWLEAVRAQLPSSAVTDAVDKGIKPRRNAFVVVCGLILIVNLALAIALFAWKDVLLWALQESATNP